MAPSIFRSPPLRAARRLLADVGLPANDLAAQRFEHFFGCGEPENPKGIVGLELHGEAGLLRSLAVDVAARGRGCAKALVAQAERDAREHGVRRLFLLTTTAADFFARLGYKEIGREHAPAAIRATREFSALCPSSSTLMVKEI